MFEIATRKKFRFTGVNGVLTTEDLWNLKLPQLDGIAKALNKQIKEAEEESFISKPTPTNSELKMKLNVVVHVINTLLEEQEKRDSAKAKREEKALLTNLLHQKNMEELAGMSKEEIEKKLQELS